MLNDTDNDTPPKVASRLRTRSIQVRCLQNKRAIHPVLQSLYLIASRAIVFFHRPLSMFPLQRSSPPSLPSSRHTFSPTPPFRIPTRPRPPTSPDASNPQWVHLASSSSSSFYLIHLTHPLSLQAHSVNHTLFLLPIFSLPTPYGICTSPAPVAITHTLLNSLRKDVRREKRYGSTLTWTWFASGD